jgi:hypothetical protein
MSPTTLHMCTQRIVRCRWLVAIASTKSTFIYSPMNALALLQVSLVLAMDEIIQQGRHLNRCKATPNAHANQRGLCKKRRSPFRCQAPTTMGR